jgi:hypothetical protein
MRLPGRSTSDGGVRSEGVSPTDFAGPGTTINAALAEPAEKRGVRLLADFFQSGCRLRASRYGASPTRLRSSSFVEVAPERFAQRREAGPQVVSRFLG